MIKTKETFRIINRFFKVKRFIYSIFSIVGALLVYTFAFLRFICKISKNPLEKFSGNILIIATGPSISKLNQNIIDNHDFVLFLNAAFQIQKILILVRKKYLLICDSLRLESIFSNPEKYRNDFELL